MSWTFKHKIIGESGKHEFVMVTCEQVPIQPGFALMGHVAQGQMMPDRILTYLSEGGYLAYVAASCATNRNGLFIADKVTVDDLNKALPLDLKLEMKKFENIAHNTLVHHGFKEGEIREIEEYASDPYEINYDDKAKKRTREDNNDCSSSKRQRKGGAMHEYALYGCKWDSRNWSCAYDSLLMPLFYLYWSQNITWRDTWLASTEVTRLVGVVFRSIGVNGGQARSDLLNAAWDWVHDFLSVQNPQTFPWFGESMAGIADLADTMRGDQERNILPYVCCNRGCHVILTDVKTSFLGVCGPFMWMQTGRPIASTSTASIQDWLTALLLFQSRNGRNFQSASEYAMSAHNCTGYMQYGAMFESLPPILSFQLWPEYAAQTSISLGLMVPVQNEM
ncbi:hypothetical protein IW262DRAFT_1462620 [Armillaria fumosa]|nr:hypothetical protein IW262DRAFT_1462620 [Armillaria fumosa]